MTSAGSSSAAIRGPSPPLAGKPGAAPPLASGGSNRTDDGSSREMLEALLDLFGAGRLSDATLSTLNARLGAVSLSLADMDLPLEIDGILDVDGRLMLSELSCSGFSVGGLSMVSAALEDGIDLGFSATNLGLRGCSSSWRLWVRLLD